MFAQNADTFHILIRIAEKGGGDNEDITEVVADLDILGLYATDRSGGSYFASEVWPAFVVLRFT